MEEIIYDLHTHSLLSDGELLPLELATRAAEKNIKTIGITDHVDFSNIEFIISSLKKIKDLNNIKIIPGIELTHIPPEEIEDMVIYARKSGIKLIIGHGETIVEPVAKGSNYAYIKAKVDVLAHPGIISEIEVQLAKENNVYLEITTRWGHSYTNGHIVKLAKKYFAKLILNSDTHLSEELLAPRLA